MSTSQWMDWFKKAWGAAGSRGSQSARRATPANLGVHRLEDRQVLNGVPAGFTGAVTESAGNIVLQAGKADGQADSYQVGVAHTASGDKLEIQVNGEKVFETKADAFKSLKVVGNEDAESLTVDLFHGTGSLTGVVGFEGGVGHGDSLTLAAGSANSIATEWSEQGGRIAVSGPSQSFTIQFGGSVDRVDDRLAATSRSFSSDVVGQTVSLNSMETPATGRIGLSDGRQFNFQTPSSQLRIDLQGASDQLHVENWQSGGNVDLKLDSKSLAIQGRMELGTGDLAIHAHRTDIAGEIVGNGDSVAVFGGDDSLVTVSGRIELTSVGESGSGGRVDLFATRVSIQDGALIDVSGAGSGGTIRVGGDLHGTPGDFTTADRVWIASDAVLRADGTGAIGAGGTVVIWSRELTGFSGTISAVGVGGAGGFAEVSSEATVLYRGSADLRGSQGTMGTLLLDPRTVTIVNQNGGANNNQLNPNVPNPGDPANAILFGDVPTGAFTISETALEAAQSNVLIQATDQIVLANLTTDGVLRMRSNVSLTLQTRNDASQGDLANGGILFQNTANTIRTQGTGKLVLQAGVSATASGVVTGRNGSANISAGSLTSATGAIQLEATGTIAAARSIVSTGGAITVAAGGEIQIAAGAELTSTNNSIQLTSTGGKIVGASNVVLTAGNQIQIDSKTTAAGNVSLSANDGIRLGANLTANGTLTVNADKNLDGVGTFQVLPGAIVSTTGGAITVTSADIDLQGGLSSSAGTTTLITTALRTIGLGQAVGDWTLDNGEISRIIAVDLIVGGTTNGAITADGVLGAGNGVSHWQLLGQAATGTPQVVFQGQSSEFRGLLVNARGGIVASADVKTTTGDLEWTSTGALAGPNPIQLVGARAISAAGKLAISNSPTMSTTGDVILRAGTGVVLSGRVSAGGSFQIDADADRDGAGVFQLTSGGNSLVTNDHSLTVIASDIVLSSTINTGTASVTLLTDRGRSMGLGNAVADWSLSSAEYGLITTATLILGDAQSGDIRVDSLPNSTTKGAVQLRATGNGQHLEFTGGTNTFTSLTAHADAGIRIDSDLTTRNGNLILDGDANQAADGSLSGHDQIVIAAGVTLTARNGAIQLTAPTGGIVGAGVVSLLADRQIQLNSKMTASGNLSLTANDGIQIGADLTVDGSVTADADADTSGPGLLRVLAGAIMATTGGDVSVTSSDIDLQGKLSSGSGTTTLSTNSLRTIGLGQAVADWTLDNGEIGRIIAGELAIGGLTNGTTTLDGVKGAGGNIDHWQLSGPTLLVDSMIHFQGAASEFTRLLVDSRRTILISADVTATVGNLDFTSFGAFAGVNPIQLEGARTLSAAGTLSLSSSIQKISASGNLNLKGGDGIQLNSGLNVAGDVHIDSDTDRTGPGTFQIGTGGSTLNSNNHSVTVISTDVNLGSGINSGTEKTTLLTHSGRTMALGTATGDWSLSPGEINNLVMAELEIGDANNGNITVGAVSRTQSSHIGLVRLNATGDDRRVEFTGGSSTFQSLNVLADAGIGVSSNLSTDTGDLTLNGDSDAMPDGDDRITFANGVVVSAGGAMRLGAATGGLLGAGTLQLLANSGVTLDDRLATAGDLTINADRNNDGVGPLVAKGRVDVAGQSALLISSDIDLQGAFSVAGTATLRSSGNRTMGIGNAAGDWRFDLAEFQRTTAVTLVFGGFSNGNVAVDGVTSTASSGVQRVEILALADTRAVTFRGTGSSFRELSVSASDGIFMQAGAKTTAGPLSFFADTDLDCVGSFVLSPGATIDSTDHEISITAADVDLSGLLTAGDGNVFLNPSCPPEVIGIGDTTADFSLSQAEFGHIVGTSGLVTVGSLANTGGMRIGTTESVALGGLRTALITGGDATVNGQLSSTTAPLLLTAGKNIRFAPTGALVSTNGPITLTADALPGNLGGGFFMDAGSKIDGGTGDVTVDADGNVELAKILTTHTASILSRSGAITHVGPSGEANITADTATLRAARGIGDTSSPLETEVRLLAAENTTSGRIEIRGVASTTLILGPTGGLSGVRNLAGEVHVVNRGDLIIQNVESPTLVSLESTAGGIFDGQAGGAADIRATSLALRSSSGIGTAVDALEIDVRRVAAENSTAGRIEIRGVSTESLTLGAVNGLDGVRNLAGDTHVVTAGTLIVEYVESFSQVSLQTLAGGILDGKAGDSPDIVANELVLRSTGGIGLATDALETSVRRLAAENTTTGGIEIRGVSSDSLTLGSAGGLPGVRNLVGDTHVTTLGDLIIENVEAPMQVSLQSLTGGIFDGHSGAGPDIRANELVLRAAGGIGTSGDALEIAVRRLAADNTTTGGIDIHGVSTDSLTLGAAGGLPGVQNRAGDLRVVTEGTLIVESAGTFGHEIEFTAADVDIPGHLSAGAGNVFLNPLQAAESIGIGDISADFTLSRDDLNHITGTSGLVTVGSLANQGGIHIATSETVDIGGLRTSLITGADTRVDGLLSSTTAPLLLTAGRNVTFGAAGALVSTQGPISITADALPGSSGSVIQMATGSRIDAGTGDVLLRTDGDITVASVKTTNSAAIRTDSGAIHRAGPDGVPNVTGGRVALVAQQGIGDPVAPLQVDAGRLAAENFASGEIVVRGVSANPLTLGSAGEGSGEFPGVRNHAGNVRVVSAGPLVIENVESSQTVALQSLAGGIVDGKGGDGIDIRAKSLQMRSSGGIGSTGPNGRLETAVDLVAATNTDGGEIDIFNNTGAGLTVGIVEGLVGLTNSGGGIAVDNAKKLSILSQVKTIGGGNISLTSDGDAKTGSDLLTMAPILAVGGNGSVFLQAGKNLVLRDSGAEFDIEVENAGQIIGVAQQMVDFGSNVQLKAGPGFVPPDAVVPGLGFVPGLGDGPVYGVVPVLSPSLLYVDAPLVHNAIATVSGQIGDPHGHGYIVVIDWHDGTKTQQFFGDPTSFQFQHFYNSNPDKTDSSKPIPITVTLYDFFQISLTGLHQPAVTTPLSLHETLTVGNGFQTVLTFAEIPGEGLAFPVFVLPVNLPQVTLPAPVTSIILNAFIVPPSMDTRVPPLLTTGQEESRVESREIVLEVLDANGGESQLISLGDDVLDDLPALFRRLPDGHYRVYLREVGEATRRLLSDVQLRGGRPSDGADAGFDALPTEEEPDFPSDAAPAPGEGSQPDKEEAAIVPSANLNSEIAPPVLRGAATARVPAPGLRRSIALAAASVVAAGASSRRPWEEEVQSALEVRGAESAPVASPWLRRIRRALGQG